MSTAPAEVPSRGVAGLALALDALPGAPAWAQYRRAAAERLLACGLPTPRDDGFRYASLRSLERRDLRPPSVTAPAGAAAVPAGASPFAVAGALVLDVVDGRPDAAALAALAASSGLRLTPLATLIGEGSPLDHAWLALPSAAADDRLRLWAAACVADGLVVEVPAGHPGALLHLRHLATGGTVYPRLRIVLGEGSTLTVIEEYRAAGGADSVTLSVGDFSIGAGATLTHLRLQDGSPRSSVLGDLAVQVGAGGRLAHHGHSFGTGFDRLDLAVELAEAGAEADLHGLFMADAGGGLHVRTRLVHAARDTRSAQTYRGIAADRGRGSYDGKVVVRHGASRAVSRQSSRNLLLGRAAEIDTRPQLEISTDDVQCSHGATTGTLDEQMLFYLRSRGLDADTARGLLTYAFAADVVRQVPVAPVAALLERRVAGLLPGAPRLEEFPS